MAHIQEKFYPTRFFLAVWAGRHPCYLCARNEETDRIYRSEGASKIPPAGERYWPQSTWAFLQRQKGYMPHL